MLQKQNLCYLCCMKQFIVLLLFHIQLMGQNCDFTLQGQVIDHHDDQPLVGAVVQLGKRVSISDVYGNFSFINVCPDTYSLVISHVSCETLEQSIFISKSISNTYYLEHHQEVLEEVEINQIATHGISNEQTLTEKQIQDNQGETFGELVDQVNGVSLLRTGATITKPVIQGMHSQRILVINQGMRMEGQQWGLEHAPEIDPYSLSNVTVIKGAGSVQYGADAIGGVVLVDPMPLPDRYGVKARISSAFASNGRSGNLSVDVNGKQKLFTLPISFQLQGSVKRAGNLKTPDYFLDNTGVNDQNFMMRAGYVGDNITLEAKLSQFHSELGILTDSHIGNTSDLLAILENGKPFVDRGFSYDIGRPRQKILHEIAQFKATYSSSLGKLHTTISRQYNRRSEFDKSKEEASLQLKTETLSADTYLTHDWLHKNFGQIGFHVLSQDYRFDRMYLIPEYQQSAFGFYAIQEYEIDDSWLVEASMRYDYKEYDYQVDVEQLRRIDLASIEFSSIENGIGELSNTFNTLFTGSFGFEYKHSPELSLSSYVGFGARQPLPNELFSDGVHHGTASWETGNPSLDVEQVVNMQWDANYNKKSLDIDLHTYINSIANYAYFAPNSTLNTISTIRGTFPVFDITQSDVFMTGIDYAIAKSWQKLKMNTSGSFLWAKDKSTEEPLIFMPANRLQHGIHYQYSNQLSLGSTIEQVFTQHRVPESISDFVAPPKGYALFDIHASYNKAFAKNKLQLQASVENIFNTEYRDYLDRYRYYAAAPGINTIVKANYFIN